MGGLASMLLTLHLPALGPLAVTTIRAVHMMEGAHFPRATKLLDFSVDLSGGMPHDCPPVSHYRIIVREVAWLRHLVVGKGDQASPGMLLALLSTEQEEPLDGPPTRAARVTVAGILHHDGWGDDG